MRHAHVAVGQTANLRKVAHVGTAVGSARGAADIAAGAQLLVADRDRIDVADSYDACIPIRPEPTVVPPPAALSDELTGQHSTWERQYAGYLRITDAFVICGAVVLAQYARFGSAPAAESVIRYETFCSVALVALWLAFLAGFRTRSPKYIGAGIEEYRRVVMASLWTFGAVAIAELLMKLEVSRGYLAVALPAGIVGLVLSRWQLRRHIVRQRRLGNYETAVLAIGDRDAVADLAEELTSSPDYGYRVVGIGIPGYGPPRGEQMTINGRVIPVIGGEGHVLASIRSLGADKVAMAGTNHFGAKGIRKLIWELEPMGVELVVSPGFMDVARSRLVMRPIAGLPLLYIDKPQYQGAQRIQKRAFDFSFALAALTAAVPVMLIAAAAIKLTSKGPVFYKAERIGMDGKPFMMFKFRTMVNDAHLQLASLVSANESDGPLFKIRDDPRITPVGRILRRFSIDELPQFINVLRREMSVVGPRPPLRREVEAYDDDVQRRLLVMPGVTGLWQVSGRSDLPWEKAVRLDLSYVDNWSLVGDILIIVKTLRAVLERRGAY